VGLLSLQVVRAYGSALSLGRFPLGASRLPRPSFGSFGQQARSLHGKPRGVWITGRYTAACTKSCLLMVLELDQRYICSLGCSGRRYWRDSVFKPCKALMSPKLWKSTGDP